MGRPGVYDHTHYYDKNNYTCNCYPSSDWREEYLHMKIIHIWNVDAG